LVAVKIKQRHPKSNIGADVHPRPIAGVFKDRDMLLKGIDEHALKDKAWLRAVQADTFSAALIILTVTMAEAFSLITAADIRALETVLAVAIGQARIRRNAAIFNASPAFITAVGAFDDLGVGRAGVQASGINARSVDINDPCIGYGRVRRAGDEDQEATG
jgi:hypothetical protein